VGGGGFWGGGLGGGGGGGGVLGGWGGCWGVCVFVGFWGVGCGGGGGGVGGGGGFGGWGFGVPVSFSGKETILTTVDLPFEEKNPEKAFETMQFPAHQVQELCLGKTGRSGKQPTRTFREETRAAFRRGYPRNSVFSELEKGKKTS